MAVVLSTAKTLAEYKYPQSAAEPWISDWLSGTGRNPETAVRMCRNAEVDLRSSVLPIEEVFRPKSLTESNRLYEENIIRLGAKVSRMAIEAAGLAPGDIDMIISVSCTGFMIPSVDAYLIDELGMGAATKRLPITELGCAAGAAGLSRAREYLLGFPDHRVLLVSVELPTLTFQFDDLSLDNIVSLAIFGDGAAAAVLSGRPENGRPEIVDSRTTTLPDSTGLMGFRLGEKGFQIILSKNIPQAVKERVRPTVEEFLAENELSLEGIDHLLLHPGGKRILEVYRDELGVTNEALYFSRKVLSECGNVSSSTILMILDEILQSGQARGGDTGLLLAMGPGFSIEQLLICWPD
ncbi:MAG: 3-oxoacyl-[acyl-carrier-protein] synthase III C-terminal domain-containing protein [Nitrospinota bacterium]